MVEGGFKNVSGENALLCAKEILTSDKKYLLGAKKSHNVSKMVILDSLKSEFRV